VEDASNDAAEGAAATDEVREGLIESFRAELGDRVVGSHVVPGDSVWVRVTSDAWREAGFVARDKLACGFFGFLSAIDWLPSPFGKSEDAVGGEAPESTAHPGEIVTGYAGGEARFQIFARVQSLGRSHAIFLKADLSEEDFTVDSWLPVYPGANWHEREAHEMFGIGFRGHPNLVALYLPTGFEGHPLRKDFPLLARMVKPWPGIVDVEPMPEEAGEEADDEGEASGGATTEEATS
jgi:NADH-quinone oxidoreductase subunit C